MIRATNEAIAIQILDEIDRARSGGMPLEKLEYALWRLLDEAGADFPPILASSVENLVLELQRLQRENIAHAAGKSADPNRGADILYNEVTGAIARYLG